MTRAPDPLDTLLLTTRDLRQTLVLNDIQTSLWSQMQADLRDATEKRRALLPKLASTADVPNPALLLVQDMASAQASFARSLDKLATSMSATFDALDDKQRQRCLERIDAALALTATP